MPRPISASSRRSARSGEALNDRAYREIRDAITSLRLAPGQSVSVGSLADWLKVGRTPIRDALQRLQHEGLVRSLPRRGMVVSQLTVEAAEELYELQEALEAMAARLAASRAPVEDRKRLVEVGRRMSAVSDDAAAWVQVDSEYHALLFKAACSPALGRAAEALSPQLARFRALAAVQRRDRPRLSAREHLQIAQMVSRGDADGAERLTHEHWKQVRAEAVENLKLFASIGGLMRPSSSLEIAPSRRL